LILLSTNSLKWQNFRIEYFLNYSPIKLIFYWYFLLWWVFGSGILRIIMDYCCYSLSLIFYFSSSLFTEDNSLRTLNFTICFIRQSFWLFSNLYWYLLSLLEDFVIFRPLILSLDGLTINIHDINIVHFMKIYVLTFLFLQ